MVIAPQQGFDFVKYLKFKGFDLIQRRASKIMLCNELKHNERLDIIINLDEAPVLCPISMPTLQVLYENEFEYASLYLGIIPMSFDHAEILFESITPTEIKDKSDVKKYKEILKRL